MTFRLNNTSPHNLCKVGQHTTHLPFGQGARALLHCVQLHRGGIKFNLVSGSIGLQAVQFYLHIRMYLQIYVLVALVWCCACVVCNVVCVLSIPAGVLAAWWCHTIAVCVVYTIVLRWAHGAELVCLLNVRQCVCVCVCDRRIYITVTARESFSPGKIGRDKNGSPARAFALVSPHPMLTLYLYCCVCASVCSYVCVCVSECDGIYGICHFRLPTCMRCFWFCARVSLSAPNTP